jgi:phenylpropionate dioxygenase-like ring-hydroxylating dioxygenase large terminal subunit
MHLPDDTHERLVRETIDRLARKAPPLAPESIEVPADRYVDPAFLDREMDVIFRGEPMFLGLSAELPEPGDFLTRELPGAAVLAIRGKDGKVRAFRNRCRHRGARVAEGSGSARRFTCPYHAWTYGLDGNLAAIPEGPCFEHVAKGRDGLEAFGLLDWAGLLFVLPPGLDEAAARRRLQPAMRELECFGFGDYRVQHTQTKDKATNWKFGVDLFMEGYHVNVLHAQTVGRTLACNFVLYEDLGGHTRLVAPRRPFLKEDEADLMAAPLHRNAIVVYCLFPNTVIACMEQHSEIHRFDPVPGQPNRMRWTLWIASSPVGLERDVDWSHILDIAGGVIEREDLWMMTGVQANLDAEGPASHLTFGRNEPALHGFHAEIDRVMGVRPAIRTPVLDRLDDVAA